MGNVGGEFLESYRVQVHNLIFEHFLKALIFNFVLRLWFLCMC